MYAGGVNFTSLLFMIVYSIYNFIVWFMQKGGEILFMPFIVCFEFLLMPICCWIDKREEKYFEILYACLKRGRSIWWVYICMYACLFHFLVLYRKREKYLEWDFIYACLFFSIDIRAYMFCLCKKGRSILQLCMYVYEHSLHIFMFIAMHELRGSFYEAQL